MQNNFIELEYKDELYNKVFKVLENVLGEDIFPLADSCQAQTLYEGDFEQVDEKSIFCLRIVISSLDINTQGSLDITSQVDRFYENKKRIIKNIKKRLFPCIKEEDLVKNGISPQDYVIKVHDFKLNTLIRNYVDSQKNRNQEEILYESSLIFSIIFNIVLTIDDVSGLIPGGEEMEKIKLGHLINSDVFSEDLKKTVLFLGEYDVDNMTDDDLKEIIKRECF